MDSYTPFKTVNLQAFFFQTTRYEEYQAGKMIDSGSTSILIRCTLMDDNRIKCIIGNNDLSNKLMSCEFDTCISLHDRLLMMSSPQKTNADIVVVAALQSIVGTTCSERNYLPNEPVVGSIYTEKGCVVKMSFTMANPERLIELY